MARNAPVSNSSFRDVTNILSFGNVLPFALLGILLQATVRTARIPNTTMNDFQATETGIRRLTFSTVTGVAPEWSACFLRERELVSKLAHIFRALPEFYWLSYILIDIMLYHIDFPIHPRCFLLVICLFFFFYWESAACAVWRPTLSQNAVVPGCSCLFDSMKITLYPLAWQGSVIIWALSLPKSQGIYMNVSMLHWSIYWQWWGEIYPVDQSDLKYFYHKV